MHAVLGTTTAFAFARSCTRTSNFFWYYAYTATNPWFETSFSHWSKPSPSSHTALMHSDCLICTGTSGNGVWIGFRVDCRQCRDKPFGYRRQSINPKKIVRGGSWNGDESLPIANRSTQFPVWTNYIDFEGP
jgi:hypothetical protein